MTITILVIVFSFVQAPLSMAAEADQYCTPGTAWVTVNGHSSIYQTFTPEMNRLSRVGLWVEGDADGSVHLRVMKGSAVIGSGSRTEPSGYALIYFDFDDLELTAGSTYKLFVTTGAGNTSLRWHRSAAGSNCYAGGAAILDGVEKDYDWGFATYGFIYTPPEEEPEEEPGQDDQQPGDSDQGTKPVDYSDQAGVAEGDNQAPNSITDSSLNTPKLLKAEDVLKDQGGAIKLSWDKINVNAGYKIFRSTEKKFESFRNIATADKNTTTFVDTKAKTNQRYYYFIRNYLINAESESSNQVNAVAIDNLSPKMPENFKLVEQTDQALKFTWDANTEDDLDGYNLTWYIKDQTLENPSPSLEIGLTSVEAEHEFTIADHPELDEIEKYNIFLQAKDVNGNLSQAAGPISVSETATSTSIWQLLIIIILAIMTILLGWYLHKQKKPKPSF